MRKLRNGTPVGEFDSNPHRCLLKSLSAVELLPIPLAMMSPRLRILVFPESPRRWTARSLEHDLAGGGTTMEGALDTLLKIARAHIHYDLRHGRQPLSAFAAAPRLYWEAFAGAPRVDMRLDLACEEAGIPMRVVAARLPQHPILNLYCDRARIA